MKESLPEQTDMNLLVRELAIHLRATAPHGIPENWFHPGKKYAEKSPRPAEALLSEEPDAQLRHEAAVPCSSAASELESLGLEELRQLTLGCTKCRLCETRNKVVFGVGKTQTPRIVFVGEGPGADEDRKGEPFVGRAGELLTKAITQGMGLRREDVYICNVVKCRPPENRTPLPDEVLACTPYLYRQLELLRPEVIITLGSPAQQALSGINQGITKIRGRWLLWRGIKLMPTFHPAYLLRSPAAKKDFWLDLQEVMKELGMNPPAQKGKSEGKREGKTS